MFLFSHLFIILFYRFRCVIKSGVVVVIQTTSTHLILVIRVDSFLYVFLYLKLLCFFFYIL
jgi:hypothetical protein